MNIIYESLRNDLESGKIISPCIFPGTSESCRPCERFEKCYENIKLDSERGFAERIEYLIGIN